MSPATKSLPHLSPRTLRNRMGPTLRRVSRGKERIVLSERGKEVAILVPIGDMRLLREIEDRQDNEAADRALAEMAATGEKPIPWEKVKERLGL